ncbi:pantetheine-phosphate adenylyltransferase [Seminibacterium arietis]|uniref:Phosphopantetheine adenylyltransferase n=1 Tax=Seminibacterium arietis TaxID=1173502 RepID=A0ABW3IB04_9PAST
MKTAIYPGTFDPITNGHLDIIERSAILFDKIIVAVAENPTKKPLFCLKERVELVENATLHLSNVKVIGFSDLLANVIKQNNIDAIIRGVRDSTDFEYERQLASLNRVLTNGVESLFFPPKEEWSYLSSTIVREVHLHSGDVSHWVPNVVLNALKQK